MSYTEQEKLMNLLKRAVSPFECVKAAEDRLSDADFEELAYEDAWKLAPGGSYYLNHHGTTLFAFTIGKEYRSMDMLRMAAAHTDYPTLRLKPNPDFCTDAYAQVNVEVYGGPILNTWFDRPLGVAGRIITRGDNLFSPRIHYYRSKTPVLIIPNLAIHMNREVNKGVEINNQVDLMPIVELLPKEQQSTQYFLAFLAKELGVEKEDILDFELNTFVEEQPCYVGPQETMLSAPRLDNQTSVSALISSVIDGKRQNGINLIALFDHEEIGNVSKQGAASMMLLNLVQRILRSIGENEESIERILYQAMMLSVDVAHGLHPNKQGKMDITNHPVLGNGFCIKEACSQSYATDAEAIAILCQICDREKIPYQRFVNRSDIRGGGTIGSVISSRIPIKTVDIGIPLLAMHSARELMGSSDISSLKDAVTAYFRS